MVGDILLCQLACYRTFSFFSAGLDTKTGLVAEIYFRLEEVFRMPNMKG